MSTPNRTRTARERDWDEALRVTGVGMSTDPRPYREILTEKAMAQADTETEEIRGDRTAMLVSINRFYEHLVQGGYDNRMSRYFVQLFHPWLPRGKDEEAKSAGQMLDELLPDLKRTP